MQRLILYFTSGDGYTYSCENHVPFVYESKEKALDDLETLLLEAFIKEQECQKLRLAHSEEYREITEKLRTCKKDKDYELLMERFRKHQESFPGYPMHEEISFGGASFKIECFFYHTENGLALEMPTVYTQDEFWAEAEANMNQ